MSGFFRKSTTSASSCSASSIPATSLKLTSWVADSTRRARLRPNWPSTPPPPAALAARRANQTNSSTSRIVGPKLNSSVWSSERSPGGSALITTFCVSSRLESCCRLAKIGISVSKRVAESSL